MTLFIAAPVCYKERNSESTETPKRLQDRRGHKMSECHHGLISTQVKELYPVGRDGIHPNFLLPCGVKYFRTFLSHVN